MALQSRADMLAPDVVRQEPACRSDALRTRVPSRPYRFGGGEGLLPDGLERGRCAPTLRLAHWPDDLERQGVAQLGARHPMLIEAGVVTTTRVELPLDRPRTLLVTVWPSASTEPQMLNHPIAAVGARQAAVRSFIHPRGQSPGWRRRDREGHRSLRAGHGGRGGNDLAPSRRDGPYPVEVGHAPPRGDHRMSRRSQGVSAERNGDAIGPTLYPHRQGHSGTGRSLRYRACRRGEATQLTEDRYGRRR